MSTLDAYLQEHQQRHLEELIELLRIPSVSTDAAHAGDVARCAEVVASRLREAGLEGVTLHPTPRHPIVYGHWLHAGPDAPTVLVYGHYDVQPPDPLELWDSPPFEPVVDTERGVIVARGASDDKGQFYCHIKGLQARLALDGKLPVNVKVLIEGEEEIGSPSLAPFLEAHREMLRADAVVISDTGMLRPGEPCITYALRGLAYLELEVSGPTRDLHSGMFGGGIANPIQTLCHLVAQLKDAEGRIAIPGFYDDVRPLDDDERTALAEVPFEDADFLAETGAPQLDGEAGYTTYERITARPTLDLCGIWGGFTGQGAKTVLPSKATAKISMRLVPNQDPEVISALVQRHLESIAPPTVRIRVTSMHGGHAALTPRDHPVVEAAVRALAKTFGRKTTFIRAGGSIPIVADFENILGAPAVMMGLGLADDRIHSPNEKFNLDHFYKGIAASAYLWGELGQLSDA